MYVDSVIIIIIMHFIFTLISRVQLCSRVFTVTKSTSLDSVIVAQNNHTWHLVTVMQRTHFGADHRLLWSLNMNANHIELGVGCIQKHIEAQNCCRLQ